MTRQALAISHVRSRDRTPICILTRVEAMGGTMRATVTDLSAEGFQARTALPLAPGARLSILLPPLGHLEAEVRWFHRGTAGCRFTGAGLTGRSLLSVMRTARGE